MFWKYTKMTKATSRQNMGTKEENPCSGRQHQYVVCIYCLLNFHELWTTGNQITDGENIPNNKQISCLEYIPSSLCLVDQEQHVVFVRLVMKLSWALVNLDEPAFTNFKFICICTSTLGHDLNFHAESRISSRNILKYLIIISGNCVLGQCVALKCT